MSDTHVSTGGVSFGGLLFIVFLILKLTHVIDWSWWWVTAPLWIGFLILVVVLIFFVLIAGLGAVSSFNRKY